MAYKNVTPEANDIFVKIEIFKLYCVILKYLENRSDYLNDMKELEAELHLVIDKDMQHKIMYQFVFLVIITPIHSQSQTQTNNNHIGGFRTCASVLLGPVCYNFYAVFRKIWLHDRLAPTPWV